MLNSAKRSVFAAVAALVFAAGSSAQGQQDERLADIRRQLLGLYGQMDELRRELTPSASEPRETGITDLNALRRLDGLEQELRGAIAKIEELEFRILRIAADGNNQLRDLEFTLVQISGGDLSAITEGAPLGTELGPVSSVSVETTIVADMSELETDMFNAAVAAYQKHDFAAARSQFQSLIEAYPQGRFVADAQYFIGETLFAQQSWADAGKAFLEAFNTDQSGPTAPKALLRLGESLVQFGKQAEACEILKNVGAMYPDSGEAGLADERIAGMDCG